MYKRQAANSALCVEFVPDRFDLDVVIVKGRQRYYSSLVLSYLKPGGSSIIHKTKIVYRYKPALVSAETKRVVKFITKMLENDSKY